jgi:glutathione S-transferase
MSDLLLYVDSQFESPWAMSAFVALEEKGVPYELKTLSLSKGEHRQPGYGPRTGRVPSLRHGDFWLAESTAIAEYMAETFPFPKHPRIFPENLQLRGTCREIQMWLRSDLMPIRSERPATMVWWKEPNPKPLSKEALAAKERLLKGIEPLISESRATLFDQWCIADADLAVMINRLAFNGEPLPAKVKAYAEANWKRPSVAKWNAFSRPAVPEP